MSTNQEFTPEELDQQYWQLIQDLHGIYPTSTADAQSLARIKERLAMVHDDSTVVFQLPGTQQAQIPPLPANNASRNAARRRGWQRRLGTIAAVLFVVVLVGSLIVSLNLFHRISTGNNTIVPKPTWTAISGRPVLLFSIHMLDHNTGWAETITGHIVRTTDGGITWKDVTPKFVADAMNVANPTRPSTDFLSADRAWIAISQLASKDGTYPSSVFRTVDAGKTWQRAMLSRSSFGVSQITFIDAQNGWVIASDGGAAAGSQALDIFHTVNGGQNWVRVTHVSLNPNDPGSPQGIPAGGDKTGFSFVNASTAWAAGSTPVENFIYFYVTHDSGVSWQQQSFPFPANIVRPQVTTMPPVFFNADDGLLLANFYTQNSAGASTYSYLTHDGGKTWGSPIQIPAYVGSSPTFINMQHGWSTGPDNKTLYVTQDGGQHWIKELPGSNFNNISQLDFVSNETGWAIGEINSNTTSTTFLLKTENGGRTWQMMHPVIPAN
jgi:photosystem II stability/assembly factor-like uncharacterized protein